MNSHFIINSDKGISCCLLHECLACCLRISPDLGDELDELAADTEPVESGQGNHRKTTKTKGKKKNKDYRLRNRKKVGSAPSDVEKPVAKAKAKASNVVGAKKPFLSMRETMEHKRKRIQGVFMS